jgi:hypothetical protein
MTAVQRTEGVRCSDADRERTSERLRTAAGEGYLTMDELDERLTRAYAARYGHELDALVLDLPRAKASPTALLAVVWAQLTLLGGRRRRMLVAAAVGLAVLALVGGAVLEGLEVFEGAEGSDDAGGSDDAEGAEDAEGADD